MRLTLYFYMVWFVQLLWKKTLYFYMCDLSTYSDRSNQQSLMVLAIEFTLLTELPPLIPSPGYYTWLACDI